MAEHTPGPWVGHLGRYKHQEAIFIVSEVTNNFVGKVYGHESQPAEANARLIAAAPELLEAAKKARQTLDTLTTRDFELGKDKSTRDALQAAIAKATGQP